MKVNVRISTCGIMMSRQPYEEHAKLAAALSEEIRKHGERGYKLHSWQMASSYDDGRGVLHETIIAVFEKREELDAS